MSRNSGQNQGSALHSSGSTTQRIGEQVAVGLATNYIYDTITKDEDKEPTADSNVLGNDEESGSFFDAAMGGIDEESGSFFDVIMGGIESIFSSSST